MIYRLIKLYQLILKQVEKHIITKSHKQFKQIDELALLSKNLYNSTLYYIKNKYLETGSYPRYNEIERHFKDIHQENYYDLPNHTSQQIMMIVDRNIKSFFALLKMFKKDKKSLNGCPKFPKYKHKTKGRNILVFTEYQIRIKNGYLWFPKKTLLKPIKTNITKDICQVRIIPQLSCYTIEVVYNKKEKLLKQNNNKASIDLGINNLASLTFNNSTNSYIINGKPLKSINQFYNKSKANIQSLLETKHKVKSSNRLSRLHFKRNNKVNDYIHKSSKKVVDLLVKQDISELVIGYNKEWKQNVSIGKKNNQNFCSIPHQRFIEQLKYKCLLKGINVLINEESYTSKCSALDKETIKFHENYVGERVYRGLFKSKEGKYLNADINGSLNIGRKVFGDSYVDEHLCSLDNYLTDRGYVYYPIKVNL